MPKHKAAAPVFSHLRPGPNGNCQDPCSVTRWRTSKFDRAHSAPGLLLSCGKLASPALAKNPEASSIDLPSV